MFISRRFYELAGTRHATIASISPSKPFRPQILKEPYIRMVSHKHQYVNALIRAKGKIANILFWPDPGPASGPAAEWSPAYPPCACPGPGPGLS